TLVYTDEEITSWGARMDWLEKNGMKAVERQFIETPDLESINKAIDNWTARVTGSSKGDTTENNSNPYPVDGLVITYDNTEYAQTGSVTGHHATRAGFAFKWKDESAATELDHIEWSCAARTISPVAVFQPVTLEGTTVKRASLCNISECERLNIGEKGSLISVIKANKIIPKVISVDKKVGLLQIPDKCPVCGSPTEVITSPASKTKTLHCTNHKCPAKQLRKFARFVSKDGVNIDGISEQTVAKFINLGWVKEYADIYKLKAHANELSFMEGFGDKSVRNLIKSIEAARNVEAHHLLYSLSIPLCGQDVCNRILKVYPFQQFIEIASGNNQEFVAGGDSPFAIIPGIGPEKSARIVEWFHDEENRTIVDNLLKQINITQEEKETEGDLCNGLTFVITGDVYEYKNRNELKAYIESQGGKVTGSVSKSTNYLINNDLQSTSSKNQKANQLGIQIISEKDFIDRFK
ncbi:MAG: NAD-dependent DNA ligase LigA, partial [Prevotella sp.]|nr:NAD-dependent DNA ligase LigA [Prevotella sp.]